MTERNIYSTRKATDRARAITAMKKRKAARNRKIAIGTVAAALAVVIIAGAAILGTSLIKNNNQMTAPATVTKLAVTDPTTQVNTATQAPADTSSQQKADSSAPADNNNSNNHSAVSDNNNNSSDQQQAQSTQTPQSDDKGYSGGVSADGIIYDRRHEVPQGAGTPLHIYETGKKSDGNYDWDYDSDNGNISVCCNYNTTNNQYDFIIYGKAQGTAHITLYYAASDTTMVPVPVTVNVDANLNVTQG
ncbi:MAG: hypothetical protein IJH32_04985 [Ruminococcus sp.]|nr:hypothetical protein [Ruminococcus sp.]